MPEYNIIVTGIFVFFARICDVSIGTIRTIVTVQGRTAIAFGLGLIEITIWILVVSTVITQVKEQPILIAFYAFGYATGNFIGIIVERKLAFGNDHFKGNNPKCWKSHGGLSSEGGTTCNRIRWRRNERSCQRIIYRLPPS